MEITFEKGVCLMHDFIQISSPVGMLTLAAEGSGLTALVVQGQKYEKAHLAGDGRENQTAVLAQARLWLERYFRGERPDPAELSLTPRGTDFQLRVWNALREIGYGETLTYGELAARLGSSARAVGSAVGRNPLSILIPCHRVLGADGSLTGYAGGLEAKRTLLRLEGGLHA